MDTQYLTDHQVDDEPQFPLLKLPIQLDNSTVLNEICMESYFASYSEHGNQAMATAAYARRWQQLKTQ